MRLTRGAAADGTVRSAGSQKNGTRTKESLRKKKNKSSRPPPDATREFWQRLSSDDPGLWQRPQARLRTRDLGVSVGLSSLDRPERWPKLISKRKYFISIRSFKIETRNERNFCIKCLLLLSSNVHPSDQAIDNYGSDNHLHSLSRSSTEKMKLKTLLKQKKMQVAIFCCCCQPNFQSTRTSK